MKPGQFPQNCENSGQNIEIRDFETTQLNSRLRDNTTEFRIIPIFLDTFKSWDDRIKNKCLIGLAEL